MSKGIFNTDQRIRLGIWGLGRGMAFFQMRRALNIDVVAGCDFNEHMRRGFLAHNPAAFATGDSEEFLRQDMDAVLVATFCPDHTDDVIRCLRAGKHVLSEVTAFHTMAEGVRLYEEVEKSGLVYNLAENYPFGAPFMYLAQRWKEGLFGELQYAEFEYVHEIRTLAHTYIDGRPIEPGHWLHNWRSWLSYHYYCTHSLGPVMLITGTRPTRVVSLPGDVRLAGFPEAKGNGLGGVAPQLIRMNNGALVRNLMGGTTNDSHIQRLWGTLGSAEVNAGKTLQLRLGGGGGSPKFEVTPEKGTSIFSAKHPSGRAGKRWMSPFLDRKLAELAAATGHGGGDFWVLYYFARQILTGEKAPWDIGPACDVTIPGILAYRSAAEDGRAFDVPDFRDLAQRDLWRHDDYAQPRFDVKSYTFPQEADPAITRQFNAAMKQTVDFALLVRAYVDWAKVAPDMPRPGELTTTLARVVESYDAIVAAYKRARRIADASPDSQGARMLREMLELGYEEKVLSRAFLPAARKLLASLRRRYPMPQKNYAMKYKASELQPPAADIRKAALPGARVKLTRAVPVQLSGEMYYTDCRELHGNQNGLLYLATELRVERAGKGRLLFGADGPVRVWVNRRAVACEPKASNPIQPDHYKADVRWNKGINRVVFAVSTNNGAAWGVACRGVEEEDSPRRTQRTRRGS